MKKLIFWLVVISMLIISGCNYGIDGGPSSLKEYLESDLPTMNPEEVFPPNARLVRAVIKDKYSCSGIELPEGVSNDCYIFGGDTITLKDTKEGYSKKFNLMLGYFPYYAFDIVEEGYTCNFLFERDKVKDLIVCDEVSREEIENMKQEIIQKSESAFSVKKLLLDEGYNKETIFGKEFVLEEIKPDKSFTLSYYGGEIFLRPGDEKIIDCTVIAYDAAYLEEGSAFIKVKKVDLCEDENRSIVDEPSLEGTISEEEAINIAKEKWVEEGKEGYKTRLYVNNEGIAVWEISNTLYKSSSGQVYSAYGDNIVINAQTKEVIRDKGPWSAQA